MGRLVAIAVLIGACGLFNVQLAYAAGSDHGTEAEAVALVKKAIAHYRQNGTKAFTDISRNPGPFIDRDLYVTVYDMSGMSYAHINARQIGKNLIDLRDADGKYIVRDRVEQARMHSTGWQDYKFFNPVSKRVEPKHAYWERADDYVFLCGVYKP